MAEPHVEDAWWREFVAGERKDVALRNKLLENYLCYVSRIALGMYKRMPESIDLFDLAQAGFLGLVDAVYRFDPTRGVKFYTYCSTKIRCAIYDDFRESDWVPRKVRERTCAAEKAMDVLRARLGRDPEEYELIQEMCLTPEKFAKIRGDTFIVGMGLAEDFPLGKDQYRIHPFDCMADEKAVEPMFLANRVEEIVKENEAVKKIMCAGLDKQESMIILLRYFENLSFKRIGEVLRVSEATVWHAHERIIDGLRENLDEEELLLYVA